MYPLWIEAANPEIGEDIKKPALLGGAGQSSILREVY